MSIMVMSCVWKHAPVDQGQLLVLLALADFADDDGWSFPAMATLAAKARMSERTAQRAVRAMQDAGFLTIAENAGPGGSNRFRVDIAALAASRELPGSDRQGGDKLTPPEGGEGGDTGVTGGVTNTTGGGDTGVTLTVIEPSIEPLRESAGADAQASAPVGRQAGAPDSIPAETMLRGSGREAFKAAHRLWPTFTTDSSPEAERAWSGLEPEERIAAAANAGRYVEVSKAGGRKLVCSFAVYLKEKRWEKLPPPVPSSTPQSRFGGPEWSALRLMRLMAGPLNLPKPTAFLQGMIDAGGEAGERERLGHQARNGFRHLAVSALLPGEAAPQTAEKLARAAAVLSPLRAGTPLFAAWQADCDRRGWPRWPDSFEAVWLPHGGPEAGMAAMTEIFGQGAGA